MPGMVITALRRTKLFLATPGTPVPINPLAQFIDTLGLVSGVLQVRVYGINITPAPSGSAAVRFAVYNTAVSEEDPSVTLTAPTPVTFVQLESGGSTPQLLVSALPAHVTRYASVMMSTHLIGTATSVTGDVTVGIDFIRRDA